MTVVLHRSSCALWLRDELLTSWDRYKFEPSGRAVQETKAGFTKLRSTSVPLAVLAPVGSRLDRDGRGRWWLVTYFNAAGIDAAAVAYLARHGMRGFRFAPAEVTA